MLITCLSLLLAANDYAVELSVQQTEKVSEGWVKKYAATTELLVTEGEAFALPVADKWAYTGEIRVRKGSDGKISINSLVRHRKSGVVLDSHVSAAKGDQSKIVVNVENQPELVMRLTVNGG